MRFSFIFCFLCTTFFALAQRQTSKLERIFFEADTVYLVRHVVTGGVPMVDRETEKKMPFPPLLVQGRPNYSIWKESKVLQDTALKRLSKILSRSSTVIETCSCIPAPEHTIFIIKGHKTSYITIAFFGLDIETSKGISLGYFDERKW